MEKRAKRALLVLGIVLAIGCIPVPTSLKDGGTRTYTAPLYRVTVWHPLTETPGEYKTGTQLQIFPMNFRPL